MQVMTIEQIKIQYPDQWVLIGNPELRNPQLKKDFFFKKG
jgi:hypothetical protein